MAARIKLVARGVPLAPQQRQKKLLAPARWTRTKNHKKHIFVKTSETKKGVSLRA